MNYYYDIESVQNVFTLCNYKEQQNHIDIFYLVDNPDLIPNDFVNQVLLRIYDRNKNFDGSICLYDLKTILANYHLAKTFGLSDAYLINDKDSISSYPKEFRLICDTDPEYDDTKYPYLKGYNSYNYDTTMLALYFYEVFATSEETGCEFIPTTAHQMREYNDELFLPQFKECMPNRLAYTLNLGSHTYNGPNYSDPRYKIRKNMMLSGRHIDVARLNEKQKKVALKRLLGQLGFQILESDKLKHISVIENTDQLLELIAYNVSDIVNLALLDKQDIYKSQFALKQGLIKRYPELIYEKCATEYKPNISPKTVRRDRLTIDSSSAQMATKSLCPYGHLQDIPCVSFLYPSKNKAKALGVPQLNILDECRKFFYRNFSQPELRAEFDKIYYYYKTIEGKNFNNSNNYKNDYMGTPLYQPPVDMKEMAKTDTSLFYYNEDGSPSSAFVIFSVGGIHGAEYNKALYEKDLNEYTQEYKRYKEVMQLYPNPIDLCKQKTVTLSDGIEYPRTRFLKSGSTQKKAEYKNIEKLKPSIFRESDKGNFKLNPKYTFTSSAKTNHEDFTSYYPNLLRMMEAFYNDGLGYDRYAEIFDDKERYGVLMNDKTLSTEQKEYYKTLRNGTKLILNSASGAGDATFESNIRMNNQIISMRIIGQLFSWRIGQAQTIKGSTIISTNTDGLYSVLEEKLNNIILAKESADIGVAIEPEPMYLISKDTNNRVELTSNLDKILNASGGTLSCRKGPNPTQSLDHPAIIDWALTEYLIRASSDKYPITLSSDFDDNIGKEIILSAKNEFEPIKFLNMFQNVIASSVGSMNYVFGYDTQSTATVLSPIVLQHYNRVFIMKSNTPNTLHLHAANAKKLTPAMINKRKRAGERSQMHDPVALFVLNKNGVDKTDISSDKEAVIKKINNISNDWFMRVENRSLYELSDNDIADIINNLDYDKYLDMLRSSFTKNWKNTAV